MIAIVTGAAGFLGKQLCKTLLRTGYEVRGVDRTEPPVNSIDHPKMTWIKRDLSQEGPTLAEIEGVEVLFHLAGATLGAGKDENLFLTVNEVTLVNVLKACTGRINKIIHASSQVVYGDIDNLSIDETYPLQGYDSAYGCSKINCENWLRWFQVKKGGEVISLRLTGFVEGGGAIDYFIEMALANKPIELYSMGNICRDYLAQQDGIQSFLAAAQANQGRSGYFVYNIGSGERLTTLELARLICSELGSSSEIIPVAQAAPRLNFVFKIDKARNELGFTPLPLSEAVRRYTRKKLDGNG